LRTFRRRSFELPGKLFPHNDMDGTPGGAWTGLSASLSGLESSDLRWRGRLAQAGREVVVLEAAEGIGTVTSSRNSEVIHAGIYYPAGSWMARMCVSGKRALYVYCADHGIPPSQLRQADRGDHTERDREAAGDPRACRSQWRPRHADAVGRGCARARARAELRRGAAVPLHRKSSTATPICWHCAATPRTQAQRSPFTPRCCAPRRRREPSRSTPAAMRR